MFNVILRFALRSKLCYSEIFRNEDKGEEKEKDLGPSKTKETGLKNKSGKGKRHLFILGGGSGSKLIFGKIYVLILGSAIHLSCTPLDALLTNCLVQ